MLINKHMVANFISSVAKKKCKMQTYYWYNQSECDDQITFTVNNQTEKNMIDLIS